MTQRDNGTKASAADAKGAHVGLDLARIRRLVDELQAEVESAPEDAPGAQDLKDEIITLRAVLDAPKEKSGWIAEGLHSIRSQLQQTAKLVRSEGVFITEIGRILGL